MSDDKVFEFSGGVLVEDYLARTERILDRFSSCECAPVIQEVNGRAFENCHELIAYCLTSSVEETIMVGLYCGDEYIALIFESDGTLVVVWNVDDWSVGQAEKAVEGLQQQLDGEAGYLVEGSWLIVDSDEFRQAFSLTDDDVILRRWGRLPSRARGGADSEQ